jgi:CRISPR/Cas system CSM-associated protein Csm2 small subunit
MRFYSFRQSATSPEKIRIELSKKELEQVVNEVARIRHKLYKEENRKTKDEVSD